MTSRVHHEDLTRNEGTVLAPQADVTDAVKLSRQRNAGYLFLTPDGGPNPYGALPAYWPLEHAAVASGCPGRVSA